MKPEKYYKIVRKLEREVSRNHDSMSLSEDEPFLRNVYLKKMVTAKKELDDFLEKYPEYLI